MLKVLLTPTFRYMDTPIKILSSGVDFINGFAPLRPTFEKLFTGAKVHRKA